MSKVTVYRVRKYDIGSDEYQTSRRWWTKDAAGREGMSILDETKTEINDSDLEPGTGWTRPDFDPNSSQGFQRHGK